MVNYNKESLLKINMGVENNQGLPKAAPDCRIRDFLFVVNILIL